MALTFLFAQTVDETGCVCVRLESDASVSAPLKHRTVEEIKALQMATQTIVVISTTHAALHTVELPWLAETKARSAIPYALEEQLAQKISTLHFAFDKQHHQHNQYLVAVMDQSYLGQLMSQLEQFGIEFHEMTLDWFALHPGEIVLSPTTVLFDVDHDRGALNFDVAFQFLKTDAALLKVLVFSDTPPNWIKPEYTVVDDPFFLWIAKRLQLASRLNLCQGAFTHGQQHGWNQKWLRIVAACAGLWLLTVLGVNTLNIIRLNHQIHQVDQDIAVVYRTFFPDAQQVISPRFRITQLLKEGTSMRGSTDFWQLLERLDQAIKLDELTIEQLDYKNKVLSVSLRGRDFNALERLGDQLKKAHLKVSQTQAASHQHNVTAVMELRI